MKRQFSCYDCSGNVEIVEVDIDNNYFFNEDGSLKKQLDPVKLNGKVITTSGWPFYETDYGHCGLCGRITCIGTCQGGV